MGHDIYGHNKAGQAIAYIRFTMGDSCAYTFYRLLDATDCYAGVSGSGKRKSLTLPQMEKALEEKNVLFKNDVEKPKDDFLVWQQKEIHKFITSCLETARKEGSVDVLFI
ncbi:MAG: hypothetical protein ACO1OT_13910 [Heyndrickxia sp.]